MYRFACFLNSKILANGIYSINAPTFLCFFGIQRGYLHKHVLHLYARATDMAQ